jgi:hypothetical protein
MDAGETSVAVPGFTRHLRGFGEEQLERHTGDLDLAYLNPAWFRFARDNGGHAVLTNWGLGANALDAISGPARDLYEREYRRCLESGKPWHHDYECSTAERYRTFHMDVFPIPDGGGLLVVHSPVVDRPHGASRDPLPPDEARYTDADGHVLQCSFCRRVQRVDGSERWDWVPDWVAHQPENVTGGICAPCLQVRFPGLSDEA